MSEFETDFTRGADPVPPELRGADPDRDLRAREIERLVTADIHIKYDDELDPGERAQDQRVHYITCPAELAPPQRGKRAHPETVTAGFIFWQAGAWFWRPSWGGVDDPKVTELDVDQEPSVELEVETEEEAIQHAMRRVAWELAGGGSEEAYA